VKARRKPGRGGESHEHASSDTGGGFLVNPDVQRRAWRHAKRTARSGGGSTRRWKASWSGEAVVFDETTGQAGRAARSQGDAVSRPDRRRVVWEDVRGYVASSAVVEDTADGRRSTEEPLIRAPPGSCWVTHAAFRGSRGGCGEAEAGGSPSSEALLGWLIWNAERQAPRPRHRRLRPRVSPCSVQWLCRREAQRRGAGCDRESDNPWGARDGNRLQKSVRHIFLAA